MGINQSAMVAPLVLALGACNNGSLDPRPLEFTTVSFANTNYDLCDLDMPGRRFPTVTEVNNELDVSQQLTDIKSGLLELAGLTGALLENHESTGEISPSIIDTATLQLRDVLQRTISFDNYLRLEKYPDEISDGTIYICGTGSGYTTLVYGKNNTDAEKIAFKVANANAVVLNSIILTEHIQTHLSRRAAISSQPGSFDYTEEAQKAWDCSTQVTSNLRYVEESLGTARRMSAEK